MSTFLEDFTVFGESPILILSNQSLLSFYPSTFKGIITRNSKIVQTRFLMCSLRCINIFPALQGTQQVISPTLVCQTKPLPFQIHLWPPSPPFPPKFMVIDSKRLKWHHSQNPSSENRVIRFGFFVGQSVNIRSIPSAPKDATPSIVMQLGCPSTKI